MGRPFVQHIFGEHLLRAKHCPRYLGSISEPPKSTPRRAGILARTDSKRKIRELRELEYLSDKHYGKTLEQGQGVWRDRGEVEPWAQDEGALRVGFGRK